MIDTEQIGIFFLHISDKVTSTNDEVKSAIDAGENEGFALCSRVQTAGKGRQGRIWESPLGGLYVSCLLRPKRDNRELSTLSLVAALSVRRALSEVISVEELRYIKIKWPNDLIYSDNDNVVLKLCGISLETHAKAVCLGIGLNVFAPVMEDVWTGDTNTSYAYLADLQAADVNGEHRSGTPCLSLELVRTAVLGSLSDAYQTWIAQGFMPFHDEYEACSYLTGRHVRIENIDRSLVACGSVLGVTDSGALSIRLDDSEQLFSVSSGEAHISAIS